MISQIFFPVAASQAMNSPRYPPGPAWYGVVAPLYGVPARCETGAASWYSNFAFVDAVQVDGVTFAVGPEGLVTLDAVLHAIRHTFAGAVAERNVAAATEAHEFVRREMQEPTDA